MVQLGRGERVTEYSSRTVCLGSIVWSLLGGFADEKLTPAIVPEGCGRDFEG
jgi:hypothetical protein